MQKKALALEKKHKKALQPIKKKQATEKKHKKALTTIPSGLSNHHQFIPGY